MKKIIIMLLAAVPFIVIVSINIFWGYREVTDTKSYEILSTLEREYNCIEKQPDDTILEVQPLRKSGRVLYQAKFISNKSYDEIKNYYNVELKRNGWNFVSEYGLKEIGKDSGDKIISYNKDEFTLNIEYSDGTHSWTYAISLNWEKK